jgi:thiol-disulfide isomerase/thioredoxin
MRSRRPSTPSFSVWLILLALLVLGSRAQAQGSGLVTLEGQEVAPAEIAQGNVIFVVWASWSPRCRDIADRLEGLKGRWGGKARVVAVNFQEERAEVERFLAGRTVAGVTMALDRNNVFSKRHAITSLPGLVVLREGRSVYAGKLPDDVEALLASLLSG